MNDALEEVKAAPAPPRFVGGGAPRSRTIILEHALEYDGKTYEAITVRKLVASEVEAFVQAVQRGEQVSIPMIDCPGAILDHLDADDFHAVNAAINDFLPRALRSDE